MASRLLSWFERWIPPFHEGEGPPPRELFAYIFFFVRQAPVTFLLALILGGVLGAIEIALFAYVGKIVDLLSEASPQTLWQDHGGTLLWMAAFVLLLRTGFMTLSTVLDEQVIVPGFFNMVKWQNHRHVMRHSTRYFQNDFAGRLATKVAQSGQSLGDFLISLLQVIWLFLIYVAGSLALFADLEWALVAALSVWCVLYAGILTHFIPRIRRTAKALAEAAAVVNGRFVDIYSNITLVKLDGDADREDGFVRAGMQNLVDAVRRYTRNITAMRFSLNVINALLIVGVSWIAIQFWQNGTLSLGAVAFALGLMLRLVILSQRMLGQFNGLFRALGTIQNSVETITQPLDVVDKQSATPMGRAKGRIEWKQVEFRYLKDTEQPVLHDISLTIEPGEKVGLVGPSGAGKSTLINLLLRLYDLNAGEILLDGKDISHVTQASLRRNFAVVQQDTALLNRSIADNIAYTRPTASRDDVRKAAKQAKAHDFILTLADNKGRQGYDAHVGERGVKLSGGQRQRITLARTILKDAPILILDEATAALDSEIEQAIQENLDRLMADKTVIAIAHRLSTLARMDRLIVLDEGKIIEQGSHEDLLKKDGLYARLWQLQSNAFQHEREGPGARLLTI